MKNILTLVMKKSKFYLNLKSELNYLIKVIYLILEII